MNSEGELVVNSSRHRTQKCVPWLLSCKAVSRLADMQHCARPQTELRGCGGEAAGHD